MTFKMPLRRSAKIVQIGISSEYNMTTLSTSSVGRPNIIPLNTITSSPSHGVSLDTSTDEITLSANKYYMGFGFFTCRRSASLSSNEGFHIGAFDSSNNLIDISQGFLCNTGACTFYGGNLNEFDGDSKTPYLWSNLSTPNETFKFQKATGGSTFTFKMAISAVRTLTVMTNSVLYILEMD
jgi:hypothetical protein